MCMSSPNIPPPPPPPQQAQSPDTINAQRKARQAAMQGAGPTVLTSAAGATQANTGASTLLGS